VSALALKGCGYADAAAASSPSRPNTNHRAEWWRRFYYRKIELSVHEPPKLCGPLSVFKSHARVGEIDAAAGGVDDRGRVADRMRLP
jgi:hypothetical protein